MRDCPNATMRDRLPDLLHGRLSEAERAEVRAHVETCDACRAELALLEQVRNSTLGAPRIVANRVVAALPPYRHLSAFERAARSWQLRVAAAVVLVAGSLVAGDRLVMDQSDTVLASADGELSINGLSDIPEADLKKLLNEIGKYQALTSVEPEIVVVPSVNRGGDE